MRGEDAELTRRPATGWTPWKDGIGDYQIEQTWHEARVLHFPKLNCSAWFDGSEHVGISLWGVHGDKWTMRKPPADWQPRPVDPVKMDRICKDWINAKRAQRGEVPLPYMSDLCQRE